SVCLLWPTVSFPKANVGHGCGWPRLRKLSTWSGRHGPVAGRRRMLEAVPGAAMGRVASPASDAAVGDGGERAPRRDDRAARWSSPAIDTIPHTDASRPFTRCRAGAGGALAMTVLS